MSTFAKIVNTIIDEKLSVGFTTFKISASEVQIKTGSDSSVKDITDRIVREMKAAGYLRVYSKEFTVVASI